MICITIISSIMKDLLYNNKVHKLPLSFCKRNFEKLARQVETLARRLALWTLVDTLTRKNEKFYTFLVPWHAGTLARKPPWHANTLARDLGNS